MLYFSKFRITLIAIFTIVFAYLTTSNFVNFDDGFLKKKINLGLDLQGGSYLLLEIDNEPVIVQRLQNKLSSLRNYFKKQNINYKNLKVEKNNTLCLVHEHDGRDLDLGYAKKVYYYIKTLWGERYFPQQSIWSI